MPFWWNEVSEGAQKLCGMVCSIHIEVACRFPGSQIVVIDFCDKPTIKLGVFRHHKAIYASLALHIALAPLGTQPHLYWRTRYNGKKWYISARTDLRKDVQFCRSCFIHKTIRHMFYTCWFLWVFAHVPYCQHPKTDLEFLFRHLSFSDQFISNMEIFII